MYSGESLKNKSTDNINSIYGSKRYEETPQIAASAILISISKVVGSALISGSASFVVSVSISAKAKC
ncbi:MAG: hypothetical protein MSH08_03930 [Ezakiella sp.]|nr:hypothetical protein [Ezakiella sp.]MDD7471671.1 hypothetical protein [Bacillota bacterium]MDY3923455.1 hypothetical protein [Ezakiella sp.]